MSRKYGGRFGGNSSEAYQRQLSAPVHKWKKAWVSPTGLQPESSYKICKWVRADVTAEDGSPAPDEDEDMEDGDEGDDVDGEDGVEGIEDMDEGIDAKEDEATAIPAGTIPTTGAEPTASAITPVPETATVTALPSDEPTSVPTPTQEPIATGTPLPSQSISTPQAETGPSPIAPTPEDEAAIPTPHTLPANAIEISNTAPHSTEMGAGDLAGVGGVEITHGEASAVPAEPESSAMEVDQEHTLPSDGGAVAAEDGDAEKGQAPEVDDGLVMGDLEPERKEFVVDGEDKPREVDA